MSTKNEVSSINSFRLFSTYVFVENRQEAEYDEDDNDD